MNARSLLESYGWAGPGHPLHPNAYKQKGHRGLAYDPTALSSTATSFAHTSSSTGLVKPLLVSKKQGNLGVGRKAHEPQAGNEWWLKGFEKALGDVGKSESERSSGVSTPVANFSGSAGKFGALYSFFVSGERLEGSLEEDCAAGGAGKRGKKRKSDEINGDAEEFEAVAEFLEVRDKDVRRRRKRDKGSVGEEFKAVEAFREVREGKSTKKKQKSEVTEAESAQVVETKEQRRERRQRRRVEKGVVAGVQTQLDGSVEDDAAARALRKAERKRRKAERAARETS